MKVTKPSRRGITRRDVVAVLVVAGVALIVALPLLRQQRDRAQRRTCAENQRRLAVAVLRYESDHGHFPGYRNLQAVCSDGQRQPTGWVFPLLRYLVEPPVVHGAEAKSLAEPPPVDPNDPRVLAFAAYGADGPDETRGFVPEVFIAALVCPSDSDADINERSTSTNYIVNTGMPDERRKKLGLNKNQLDGVFFDRFTGGEIPDVSTAILLQRGQLSATLMLSENVDADKWTDHEEPLVGFVWLPGPAPGEAPSSNVLLRINQQTGDGDGSTRFARPSSHHFGGVNAMYCDGHGDFLRDDIDYDVFRRLMSPDDALVP